MDWVLVLHLTGTAVVVVSLLCGDWPIFHGTPFQSINHFITVGAHDLLLRGTEFFCGNKGRNAFLRIENYCCERPNPILQILYFATIGVIYYVALKCSSFYIPGYYVSNIHWYGSIVGLVIGICLFLITSISDPGTIDSKNASRYLSTYSFDGVIYINKQCSTCNIPRPARSKHCSICDRCVARFDHHCGWMNNCIGEKNLRYFLAFLLWHAFLCLYGVVILIAILLGEWKKQRVALILTVYYGIENSFTKLSPHFVQWALNFYRTQVLLVSFLAIMFLLLAGFLSYHTYLVVMNMTTNETYKWDDYKRWQQSLTKVKAATESLNQSSEVSNAGQKIQGNEKVQDSKCSLIYFRLKLKNLYGTWKNRSHDLVIKNAYDEGLMHNIREVFYPISCRRSFFMTKAD